MFEFLYLVFFRWLSGAQNGFGYGRYQELRLAASLIMLLILSASIVFLLLSTGFTWPSILASLFALVSMFGAAGVEDAFNDRIDIFPKDIHLFELLATGGITLAWIVAGGNLISIAAATYPGLIMHKGLINTLSGLPFWHHGTDDPTGKTFSIPLLNIKVPRLSQRGRIIAALVSVVLAVVASSWWKDVTLYTILQLAGINL